MSSVEAVILIGVITIILTLGAIGCMVDEILKEVRKP